MTRNRNTTLSALNRLSPTTETILAGSLGFFVSRNTLHNLLLSTDHMSRLCNQDKGHGDGASPRITYILALGFRVKDSQYPCSVATEKGVVPLLNGSLVLVSLGL